MRASYCRSMLCTPATDVARHVKCHQSGADIAQVDLEDSVPLRHKEEARRKASAFFSAATAPPRCAIRINAVTEPNGLRDLLALRDYPVKPSMVVIPKVESARDVEIVEAVLSEGCPRLELSVVIETPRGLENLPAIAASSPRLRALIFGSADYAAALGIGLAWEPLVYARSKVVSSARSANIDAIDSPLFDLGDLSLLAREAERARGLGFSGKIALHPKQIPVINEVFSPSAAEPEHADRVITAARRSGEGVTAVAAP